MRRPLEDRLRARFASLIPREREIFRQVVAGRLNKQIADDLAVSERTVKAQRAQIMAKLGVASTVELGRLAERMGRPTLPLYPIAGGPRGP